MSEHDTRSVTLVLQRVCATDETFKRIAAVALIDYALDLLSGNAGNGVFERHLCNGVRIEAIASLPPIAGTELREDFVETGGVGALRERLLHVQELTQYLPGGDATDEIAAALGYTSLQAADEIRQKLADTLAALPEGGS